MYKIYTEKGTTSFFVMASMRPKYNEKITIMSALAPVAFFKHAHVPFLPLLRNMIALSGNAIHEFLPRNDALKICLSSKARENTCQGYAYQLLGKDPKMWNTTMLPVYMLHMPSGCNFKQFKHYVQLIDSGRFCQYDYGAVENQKRYGSPQPRDYPLNNIGAPMALYYTQNDVLSNYKDVMNLAKELPNVVENCLFPDKKWNHVSMMWGLHVRELAHKHMVDVMRKFEG